LLFKKEMYFSENVGKCQNHLSKVNKKGILETYFSEARDE